MARRRTPEASTQRAIMDLCALKGIPCYRVNSAAMPIEDGQHRRRYIHGTKGFPDLTLLTRAGVVFVEVKSPKGKLTDDQLVFRTHCWRRGITYIVARRVEDVFLWVSA